MPDQDVEGLHHHLHQTCCLRPGSHAPREHLQCPSCSPVRTGACLEGSYCLGRWHMYVGGVYMCVWGQLPTLTLDFRPAVLTAISWQAFVHSSIHSRIENLPGALLSADDMWLQFSYRCLAFRYNMIALSIKILILLLVYYHYFSIF